MSHFETKTLLKDEFNLDFEKNLESDSAQREDFPQFRQPKDYQPIVDWNSNFEDQFEYEAVKESESYASVKMVSVVWDRISDYLFGLK